MFHSKKELKHSPAVGYAAFAEPTDCEFELWQDGKKIQTYKLPDYSKWGAATPWRVALTPLSVTGDTALTVGATMGAAAYISMVASNGQVLLLALAFAHR